MNPDTKASYYQQRKTVADYDRLRFSRGGGPVVAEKESAAIRELIHASGAKGRALDCPCGTGRFIGLLGLSGFEVTASDLSEAMLEASKRHSAREFVLAPADSLPVTDDSFDLWLMSRFVFHFHDPRKFLREAHRVLKPGGVLIFDTYRWTPRNWIPGKMSFLGGRTFAHPRSQVQGWADELGFEIVAEKPVFFFAPYFYGFLPEALVRGIEELSSALLPRFKTKSYYLFKKIG